jgi:hypothetical protein
MEELRVSYDADGFQGRYYTIVYFNTKDDRLGMGASTLAAEGIYRLFVSGKKVVGLPCSYTVKLTNREAKVFQLIARAEYHLKRAIWKDFVTKRVSKEEMLKRLEKELPVCILGKKLKQE